MSQQFSKLQANAPPKPPDAATGLVPARVQHGWNRVLRLPIHLVERRTRNAGPCGQQVGRAAERSGADLGLRGEGLRVKSKHEAKALCPLPLVCFP